jgi:hypothetical protein
MADDFLATFMGDPARAKILRVFFFDPSGVFTAPLAAKRSGLPVRVAAKEIQALEQWGILKAGKYSIVVSDQTGGKRTVDGKHKEPAWTIDSGYAHAAAISKFVHEVSPVRHDNILAALKGSGRLAAVILSGSFMGDPSRPADLIIAADGPNESRIEQAVRSLEPQFGREIRYAVFSIPEFRYRLTIQDRLIRDTLDYPHLVLLDKEKLL